MQLAFQGDGKFIRAAWPYMWLIFIAFPIISQDFLDLLKIAKTFSWEATMLVLKFSETSRKGAE